jgi:hypothetical protein
MGNSLSGVKSHDDLVAKAEGVRQAAAVPGASQATLVSADVTFYKAVVNSALANGVSPAAAMQALKELGQSGR